MRPLALTAALLTALTATAATTAAEPAPAAPAAAAAPRWVHSCAAPARADTASCDALRVIRPGTAATAGDDGYGPAELRAAYGLPADGGEGATIALVDAYDHPRAEADLGTYRERYGLPACTSASGCFRKTDQRGGTRLPRGDTAWAGETALDLAMVSAVAPRARIVLVEADSAAVSDLGTAVDTAVALGARYVSISWGTTENANAAAYDSRYFDHPGVVIAAASGDGGYGVNFPASSPHVVAVGGTTLRPDGTAPRGWSESAWSTGPDEGAASGCSGRLPKPDWQTDPGCDRRTVADVSAVADPATGVAVYQSYGGNGWYTYGGTSAAAPIIAATYALAGRPSAGSRPASFPYRHPDALHDVTSGATADSCDPAYLCTAGPGYDGPTGLGSPDGVAAFREG